MHFSHLYSFYRNRTNINLLKILEKSSFENSILLKAIKYSTLSKGKRLRACLIYALGKTFKVNITVLDVISAVIELIHSYSLIHDDLPCIDNDDFRRGQLSCHIKYGESISLLAGDALQSLAFNVLSSYTMPHVSNSIRLKMITELSDTIGPSGMCFGQMLDIKKNNKASNISQLKKINLYKTAFLIRSSFRLVFLASSFFSKKIALILDRCSISFGLAFQLQDDIFDLKEDIKKSINTYPYLLGLKKSKDKVKNLYRDALLMLKLLQKKSFNTDFLEFLIQSIIKRFK